MKKVALIGNPNTGKSTLFNTLTGQKQATGNLPGVTVSVQTATLVQGMQSTYLIDLPGIYSIYSSGKDAAISLQAILNKNSPYHPDVAWVVANANKLQTSLLLCTQIQDLGIPCVLIINQTDLLKREIHLKTLDLFQIKCIYTQANTGKGIPELLSTLTEQIPASQPKLFHKVLRKKKDIQDILQKVQADFSIANPYRAFLLLQTSHADLLAVEKEHVEDLIAQYRYKRIDGQTADISARYEYIDTLELYTSPQKAVNTGLSYLDKLLLHPIGGYLCFLGILFFIFQVVFYLAEYPMQWIESVAKLLRYCPPKLLAYPLA